LRRRELEWGSHMNERPLKPGDDAPASKVKDRWIKPEVGKLLTGSAESSDGADTDGTTLS
jgi:hypothetical protein